jgi:hypothetical protein
MIPSVTSEGSDLVPNFGIPYTLLLVETCITDVMFYLNMRSVSDSIFGVSLLFIHLADLLELVVSAYIEEARNNLAKVEQDPSEDLMDEKMQPIYSSSSTLNSIADNFGDYIMATTSIPMRRESFVSYLNQLGINR